MTPRSAQALLTIATNRAPLDFRIFPSCTARFTRLRASKMMFLGTLDASRRFRDPALELTQWMRTGVPMVEPRLGPLTPGLRTNERMESNGGKSTGWET